MKKKIVTFGEIMLRLTTPRQSTYAAKPGIFG